MFVAPCDTFFDQALFQADAQLAGTDLDEVFRFERRELAQSFLKQRLLPCWTTLPRQRIVDVGDIGQVQRRRRAMIGEDFLGAGADVAVMPQDRAEFVRIFRDDRRNGAQNYREADGQDAFFAARENSPAEIKRAERGVSIRPRAKSAQIVGDQAGSFRASWWWRRWIRRVGKTRTWALVSSVSHGVKCGARRDWGRQDWACVAVTESRKMRYSNDSIICEFVARRSVCVCVR